MAHLLCLICGHSEPHTSRRGQCAQSGCDCDGPVWNYPTIEEFLLARIKEVEVVRQGLPTAQWWAITNLCNNQRLIIEWHKNWPIMVETEPKFEMNADLDTYRMSISSRIAWLTQEEYRKKFGSEPPTAPLLRKMANAWQDHADYNPEWGI